MATSTPLRFVACRTASVASALLRLLMPSVAPMSTAFCAAAQPVGTYAF